MRKRKRFKGLKDRKRDLSKIDELAGHEEKRKIQEKMTWAIAKNTVNPNLEELRQYLIVVV